MSDAPAEYIDAMLRAIVGFEIAITGVVAKFKGSQNRSAADRAGVGAALRAAGRSRSEIAEIAPDADPPRLREPAGPIARGPHGLRAQVVRRSPRDAAAMREPSGSEASCASTATQTSATRERS